MINPSLFTTNVPFLYPGTSAYIEFWREEKKRNIEGAWQSGIWMPPKLYFYINYGTIKKSLKGSKVKSIGRPDLRDLEWEFFYNLEEARGFSGFSLDQFYSCSRFLIQPDLSDDELVLMDPFAFDSFGNRKEYVPAKEYLRRSHDFNLGSPLHNNEARNIMLMGSRGFGKSYSLGVGVALHEFLFDGLTSYDPQSKVLTSSEVVIGAGDAKYSSETLSKTKLSLEFLPGSVEVEGKFYPSPFAKQYVGSWSPGKEIRAEYLKKVEGGWKTMGSKSNIKHRTFKDNPFAANGTRPGILIMEEVGMFDNLKESYAASVECQRDGSYKFGTTIFIGTGGDMNGGGTHDAYEIFYHPEKYDCLAFDDIWEHKGKIGYFVPAYLGLNQYKDSNGKTNVEAALKYLKEQRAKLSKGSDSGVALEAEIINRPIAPSEIFLVKTGNIFPVIELSNRLHEIERENITNKVQKVVDLFFDPKSPTQVSYKLLPDPANRPINQFPYNGNNREGAIVVYEFPQLDPNTGQPPKGLYIIGHDPYASDNPEGDSLAAIYVLKTKAHMGKFGHDEIVASYVGRPFQGRRVVNEILHKMSLFYGEAKIYFENAVGNTKEYFEKVKRLDLLARRPTTVLSQRASYDLSPRSAMEYGYPMSNKTLKVEAINYVRDWLLEVHHVSSDREIRNLDMIQDEGLIRECISFNFDMNADRVMAFAGCIVGLEETFNQYRTQLDATVKQVSLDFLSHNPHIFKTFKHGDFSSLIPEAKTLF